MPKYTDITIHRHIYISSTHHYYPTILYKNNGAPNNTDFDRIENKPKYFQATAHEQLYRVLMSPDTKFYEHDRDGNRRYSEYRYHGAESFYYLVTGAGRHVSNIRDTWGTNSFGVSNFYKMNQVHRSVFYNVRELYTQVLEQGSAFTGVNSTGERVILDLAAVAPWRPEFTIELRHSINWMVNYVDSTHEFAKISQQEPPSNTSVLAAIEHTRKTLNQLSESTPESEA